MKKPTSERNKNFRSHCDVDVTLDKENNSVTAAVTYKPELLEMPLSDVRHTYQRADIVEELARQGIAVDASTGSPLHLDNTTVANSRQQYLEATYVFKLASTPPSQELAPKKVTKRKSTKTKTTDQ